MQVKEQLTCRICDSKLKVVLDLGNIFPSTFVDGNTMDTRCPLELAECEFCGLVQLGHTVSRDQLYRNYWYKSGLNKSMVEALQNVVDGTLRHAILPENPVVVDIGANDGTMIGMYPVDPFLTVAYEPAKNLEEACKKASDVFIGDYFSYENYSMHTGADIITAIAMFYDLDDPISFLDSIKTTLAPDGIFVVQMTDLYAMLTANAFDNICHEHLCYYSLKILQQLFFRSGLEIFNVERNNVNGGSIRLYAAHTSRRKVDPSVQMWLNIESDFLIQTRDPIVSFKRRVNAARSQTKMYIESRKARGESIFGLGASTKGNTLLQYYDFTNRVIDGIYEINPDKLGKMTIGTNIPIVAEGDMWGCPPGILLVLPWHFRDYFIVKLAKYVWNGGKLLFPLPVPEIVDMKGKTMLWQILGEKPPGL